MHNTPCHAFGTWITMQENKNQWNNRNNNNHLNTKVVLLNSLFLSNRLVIKGRLISNIEFVQLAFQVIINYRGAQEACAIFWTSLACFSCRIENTVLSAYCTITNSIILCLDESIRANTLLSCLKTLMFNSATRIQRLISIRIATEFKNLIAWICLNVYKINCLVLSNHSNFIVDLLIVILLEEIHLFEIRQKLLFNNIDLCSIEFESIYVDVNIP